MWQTKCDTLITLVWARASVQLYFSGGDAEYPPQVGAGWGAASPVESADAKSAHSTEPNRYHRTHRTMTPLQNCHPRNSARRFSRIRSPYQTTLIRFVNTTSRVHHPRGTGQRTTPPRKRSAPMSCCSSRAPLNTASVWRSNVRQALPTGR
jgi:hypothetical protein